MASGEKRETSYYEVALTNRQVVGAFVILLVGLMVSFLAGVWVGRGNEVPARPALQLAEAGPKADQEAEPLDGVEKLDFFAADGAEPRPAAAPPTAVTEPTEPAEANPAQRIPSRPPPSAAPVGVAPASGAPTPRLDAGAVEGVDATTPKWRRRGQVAREAQELESEFASAEAELAAAAPAQVGASPASPAPASPQPAQRIGSTPQPTPPPPRPTEPEPAPAGKGVFVVQVFSSSDAAKARGILDTLKDAGYPAMLLRNELVTPAMYRVRVGPYRDRPAAQKAAEELRTRLRVDTWVTTE